MKFCLSKEEREQLSKAKKDKADAIRRKILEEDLLEILKERKSEDAGWLSRFLDVSIASSVRDRIGEIAEKKIEWRLKRFSNDISDLNVRLSKLTPKTDAKGKKK